MAQLCAEHDIVVPDGGSCWCCAQKKVGADAYATHPEARQEAHQEVAQEFAEKAASQVGKKPLVQQGVSREAYDALQAQLKSLQEKLAAKQLTEQPSTQ